MLQFIDKKEFFEWLDAGIANSSDQTLKGIQDAWILSRIGDTTGKKVAEIGGGNSRTLEALVKKNQCWNIDKFEGAGAGPKTWRGSPKIQVIKAFMGDFSTGLEDGFFDVVYSVSVIEHVPTDRLGDFFRDVARILKPGSYFHSAIDLYLGDESTTGARERIGAYLSASIADTGLEFVDPPAVSPEASFSCAYATNSDITMNIWNKVAPALRDVRETCQSVSLAGVWKRI